MACVILGARTRDEPCVEVSVTGCMYPKTDELNFGAAPGSLSIPMGASIAERASRFGRPTRFMFLTKFRPMSRNSSRTPLAMCKPGRVLSCSCIPLRDRSMAVPWLLSCIVPACV